jgi:Recombination endonuclease VII
MDEETRQRRNASERARTANDAEYREKQKVARRERHANDDKYREKQNAARRERYANDDEYREKRNAARRERYANDAKYRERRAAAAREKYASDGEYRERCKTLDRARHLKRKYGISIEEYTRLLHQQNHACAICERPFDRTPHIDHCHLTHWVRGLLCLKCNMGLGCFDDNPIFLFKAALYALRWYLHLLQVFNKQVFNKQVLNREEHDMTTSDDSGDENRAARVMRKAILHELHQPFGVDPPPPTDHLQAIARALVTKAAAQDVSAIKEILDRIDGKVPSSPTLNDLPQLVNLSWKMPSSPSEMSPSNTHPSRKSKSTTGRAPNSSRSTAEPSGSPAS